MKKLLSLFLALTIILSLSAPTLAVRKTADPSETGWQEMGYDSLEAALKDMDLNEADYYTYFASPDERAGWIDAYLAAHPDEAAAFDADAFLKEYYGGDWTKADYMEYFALKTDEEFVREMTVAWINSQLWQAEQKATVDAYTAAHPAEVAAFNADAYFEKEYLSGGEDQDGFLPGYTSKEEFMTSNMITTEEDFRTTMLVNYIYEQEALRADAEAWAAIVAAEPALTTRFLAEVDGWLADGYWYGSLAEYMEKMGCSAEAAYLSLYEQWKADYEFTQQQKAQRDARIKELGGAAGQINVLVNDKMIAFGNAKPVLDGSGTLTVPADALSKALGIMVKGDVNGYAPLRTTAETAGWDVLWDNDYRTAVLINRTGVIGEIDAGFTKLDTLCNKLLELVKREEGQSYRIDETISFSLTAFDSLDGDKTFTAGVKGTSTVKDGVVSASLTLDLAGLVRQLSPELKKAITADLPKKISPTALLELLTGVKVDVIWNPEDGLYIHAPILAQFYDGVDADSWIYFEGPSYYAGEAADDAAESLSIGTMLYFSRVSGYYTNEVDAYFDVMESADAIASVVGNDRFTVSGDDVSYQLDTKTVNALVAKSTEDSYDGPVTDLFRTAEVGLTLSGGKLSMKAEVRPNTESMAISAGNSGPGTVFMAWLASLADFRFKAGATATAASSNLTMELHWKNQFKATVNYTSATQKTNTAPAVEPPADADVVDAADILYGIDSLLP